MAAGQRWQSARLTWRGDEPFDLTVPWGIQVLSVGCCMTNLKPLRQDESGIRGIVVGGVCLRRARFETHGAGFTIRKKLM
jgi:hypothetical protein